MLEADAIGITFVIMLCRYDFILIIINPGKYSVIRCPLQHIAHKTIAAAQVVEGSCAWQ
ncbi:hypothetical protein D3C87_2125020 [compost metagenome]